MEIASCKVNQSRYCVWKEKENFIIEDVEASKFISIFEAQLWWTLHTISDFLNNPGDRFFTKDGEVDRGQMKIFKFQANSRWILNCDIWSYSGGYSILRICSGVNMQGWSSFCRMLKKYVDIVDYPVGSQTFLLKTPSSLRWKSKVMLRSNPKSPTNQYLGLEKWYHGWLSTIKVLHRSQFAIPHQSKNQVKRNPWSGQA